MAKIPKNGQIGQSQVTFISLHVFQAMTSWQLFTPKLHILLHSGTGFAARKIGITIVLVIVESSNFQSVQIKPGSSLCKSFMLLGSNYCMYLSVQSPRTNTYTYI